MRSSDVVSELISGREHFGARIAKRRRSLGLSQEQVAAAAGTTRQLVMHLENGTRDVGLSFALKVASELGLDLRLEDR